MLLIKDVYKEPYLGWHKDVSKVLLLLSFHAQILRPCLQLLEKAFRFFNLVSIGLFVELKDLLKVVPGQLKDRLLLDLSLM